MRTRTRIYIRFMILFALIGGLGLGATFYLLVEQRLALPFQSYYHLSAAFPEAPGVHAGLGQPVNVAGVTVGQVSGVSDRNGLAVIDMEIERDQLRHVYADATATLQPISPLNDMQIELDPGGPPAQALPDGATLPVGSTTSPVDLTQLLDSLDGDTRDALASLITSLHDATAGRASDFRQLMLALGPTTAQVGEISRSLAARDHDLALLVHNLSIVAHAASQDRQLGDVVNASNATLGAVAGQQAALKDALSQLPPTLEVGHDALTQLRPFANNLTTTLQELQPSVRRLPTLFAALRPFAQITATALKNQVRPLVRAAQPVVADLGAVTPALSHSTPDLSRTFQVLEYLGNVLAYNPGGNDPGGLFWLDWFLHNANSDGSSGDAHGPLGRAAFFFTCNGLQGLPLLQAVFNITGLCPS